MITSIELQNFKGISDRVRIDLRPLTLLFGPNSAGKSTFLQSLVYLREVLNTYNIDSDRTEAGGTAVDLGGFSTLVHQHDLQRKVRIAVAFQRDLDSLSELERHELKKVTEVKDGKAIIPFQFWKIEFEFAYDTSLQAPTVSGINIGTNGGAVCSLSPDLNENGASIDILGGTSHPIFATSSDSDEIIDWERSQEDETSANAPKEEKPALNFVQVYDEVFGNGTVPISSRVGALPDINVPLTYRDKDVYWTSLQTGEGYKPSLSSDWPEDLQISYDEVTQMLTRAVLEPLRALRETLNSLLYLGPLREIPERNYQTPRTRDARRWATGLGAWDVLHQYGNSFTNDVSSWLHDADRLNTNYSLKVDTFKELPLDHELLIAIEKGSLYDDFENVAEEFRNLKERREIFLIDQNTGSKLVPRDIGTGISQVLPVVVAALQGDLSLVAIEQPELHIHPAMQVALGDLLLQEIRDGRKQFLIETHSEHLMLRILRRVREANENQQPWDAIGARVGDISVVYVESDGNQVKVHQLQITKDGDFQGRWPKGFFDERAKELF